MENDKTILRQLRTCLALAVFIPALTASGANFQFGVLIQAGQNGNANFEEGIGNTSAAPSVTANVTPYWTNNQSRQFTIEYLGATNTVNVRVYDAAAVTFDQVSFNPVGGPASRPTNAVWTLPASSFFVTALAGVQADSIQVSSLTLSGISSAINLINPITQTTLTANRPLATTGLVTMNDGQNVQFQADNTGSWRLTGLVTFAGLAGGPNGSNLNFQLTALASDVPEPGTLGFGLLGLSMIGVARFKTLRRIFSN